MDIPEKERAIVLQGGGSLGAYEAGAYRALYESLSEKDTKEGRKGRSTFDIVAGTSIGAINAAVLVSYVVENHTYEGSAERLIDFWNYLSKESMVDTNPFFKPWWDYWHAINREIATGEAARRYFSAKEFAIFGVPNVFYPHRPTHDSRFYDSDNTWYRYSNEPLKRSLERFAKFPIATDTEDNQPRLLLVAVDVADGIPVTFDSYPKDDGRRKTEYGRFLSHKDKEIGFEHVVHYDKGITSDQVMASGSFPVNFDFTKIEVESYSSKPTSSDAKTPNTVNASGYRKCMRYFWDGGLMTNTPLMQLVIMHRQYWLKVRGLKDNVPRLGICVINLHPKKQTGIPSDRDGVINRNNDITFSDRTDQEQATLLLISDYVDLIRELLNAAEEKGVDKNFIANLLNRKTTFHGQFMKPRRFQDILEGRWQIDEIIRVNRENDADTISNKIFDFSSETINLLLERGYDDALDGLEEYMRNQPSRTSQIKE
ncbi:MAG: patatin-like phospholipase family protein [Nitrososphaeraceae archaeon]